MRKSLPFKGLTEKILSCKVRKVFLLGGIDTAKTSLVEALLKNLAGKVSLGVIDCDMGQSHIGPPTTIAWARIEEKFSSWEDLKPEDFYFVGSLSPSGNILRTLEGVEFILKKASSKVDRLIFDTTGYIKGQEALYFKKRKIELIQPDLIVALQREEELGEILKNIEGIDILRMRPPQGVRAKSLVEREEFRDKQFRKYFSQGKRFFFSKEKFIRLSKEEDLVDRIVSLRDRQAEDLALGRVLEEKDRKCLVLTPWERPRKVFQIVVGFCKWRER